MTLPVLTAIIIVFIIWINYEIHKNSKRSENDTEKFWKRESDSNTSRRSDISELNYIVVSTDRLPIQDCPDNSINYYRDIIVGLSGHKVINLSNNTNTDLKFKYGASNLKELTQYDNNYITLVSNLQKWANRLYDQGYVEKAAMILEYAVSCNTDVLKSYQLLAKIYKLQNNPEKIKSLITKLSSIPSMDKDKLIEDLTRISNI